ncbi:hypothetical protein BH23GEM2_BH23GEM2_19030 [soil metagenome]
MRFPLIFAALAFPLAVGAQGTDNSWSWSGAVEAGKWLRVASVNGPIDVEPSTDGRVHVTAEKKWRTGDPQAVRFEVVERNGNVTICALWNENATCNENGMSSRGRNNRNNNNDTQVHFRVRLPATANVAPTTVNGAITVAGARQQVRATTVNGGIEIGTSSGPVSATTVNGSIKASVGAVASSDMKFTTVNGGIDLAVPREFAADVHMTTVNGGITTDFPITIQGRWGPRTASGRIGTGGGDLHMTTVNGSLALRSM